MVKKLALLHDCSFTKIPCIYANSTIQIQIIRITNISNCYLERVVLPRQHLRFEATPDAQLEIHTHTNITAIVSNKISCRNLAIIKLECHENHSQKHRSCPHLFKRNR